MRACVRACVPCLRAGKNIYGHFERIKIGDGWVTVKQKGDISANVSGIESITYAKTEGMVSHTDTSDVIKKQVVKPLKERGITLEIDI